MKTRSFEDTIKGAKDDDVKKLFQEVDVLILAKAIKATSPEVAEKIYQNIPAGEVDKLKSTVVNLGPVQLQEVEKAQKQISDFFAV
jgi:flagellar motor switch protein FliG